MARLVLLGGPPGIGKSTTLGLLQGRIPGLALLDADDVWRVSPDLAVPANRSAAIGNVVRVLRGYFESGCEVCLIAWVFARSELYQPVIDGVGSCAESVQMLYLTADAQTIGERLDARGESERLEYALGRLALIEALPYAKFDTTARSPAEVADWIEREISS